MSMAKSAIDTRSTPFLPTLSSSAPLGDFNCTGDTIPYNPNSTMTLQPTSATVDFVCSLYELRIIAIHTYADVAKTSYVALGAIALTRSSWCATPSLSHHPQHNYNITECDFSSRSLAPSTRVLEIG